MLQRLLFCIFVSYFLCGAGAGESRRKDEVVEVVQSVSPAVVNIRAEEIYRQKVNPFFGADPFFDEFFGSFFDEGAMQREVRTQSLGTGVVIDPKGLILTNEHVVAKASEIGISLADGREFKAEVVAADNDFDLAVLRVKAKEKLPSARIGKSSDLMPGETVVAIGNPFGLSHTVTAGVVSAVQRSVKTEKKTFHGFIQTDASINPGNSGGPLLNMDGEVIGINTAIFGGGQGIGFAIPIDKAKAVVDELLRYGEVRICWIGVVSAESPAKRKKGGGEKAGVAVAEVEEGSPAGAAGLEAGDVISAVNGEKMKTPAALRDALRSVTPGEEVRMDVWKGGTLKQFTIKAVEYPEKKAEALGSLLLGVEVKDGKRGGVVVAKVVKGSIASEIGIQPGDAIHRVGEKKIRNKSDFKQALLAHRYSDKLLLLVEREGYGYYVSVPIEK